MGRLIRKTEFCLYENKGLDQCFHYMDSTIPLFLKSELLAFFCDYTGLFVSHGWKPRKPFFSRLGSYSGLKMFARI